MSKIKEAFQNGKAFIPFITCGDPDLETTKKIVGAKSANGADLIELGIPFSDPTAEGPVIQEANIRALKNHITTDDVFEMVKELRQELSLPLVFMTYANVIFSYGTGRQTAGAGGAGLPAETAAVGAAGGANAPAQALCGIEGFAARAAECGINGIILPDVPFEEREEFAPVFRKYGIDLISMIAPTSHTRIRTIAEKAEGFVYVVSSLGVTGIRQNITTDLGAMVALVREANPEIPCAIGFGIATPEQAERMGKIADGVIVGSAIVKQIGTLGTKAPEVIGAYTKEMKEASNRFFIDE